MKKAFLIVIPIGMASATLLYVFLPRGVDFEAELASPGLRRESVSWSRVLRPFRLLLCAGSKTTGLGHSIFVRLS